MQIKNFHRKKYMSMHLYIRKIYRNTKILFSSISNEINVKLIKKKSQFGLEIILYPSRPRE